MYRLRGFEFIYCKLEGCVDVAYKRSFSVEDGLTAYEGNTIGQNRRSTVFRVSQPPNQRNRVEISADLRSRETFHRNNLHLGSILSRVHRIVCIARRKLWHSIFFTVSMQLLSEYLSHLHLLAATDFTMCTTKDQKYLARVENISQGRFIPCVDFTRHESNVICLVRYFVVSCDVFINEASEKPN